MTSLKELPYVAKIGLITLGFVMLAVGIYYFLLAPIKKANELDGLTLKSKNAEIAQLAPYRAKLAELTAQTEGMKAKMEAQKKVVPEEKEVPSFITLIANEAAASGVEVRRYSPKETTAKEYYVEVPFDIDVDGPFYSVLNFYDHLQKLERIVNVGHLTMGALKGGGKVPGRKTYKWSPSETVSANCLLTTFYASSSTVAKPAVPASKAAKK